MKELPHYPANHQVGMRVPKGGSSCSKCEYLGDDGKSCKQKDFVKWNGSNVLPAKADEYCCDFFEPNKEAARGIRASRVAGR